MLLEKYRCLTHPGGMTARKMIIGRPRNLRIPYPVQSDASVGPFKWILRIQRYSSEVVNSYQLARLLDSVVIICWAHCSARHHANADVFPRIVSRAPHGESSVASDPGCPLFFSFLDRPSLFSCSPYGDPFFLDSPVYKEVMFCVTEVRDLIPSLVPQSLVHRFHLRIAQVLLLR